MSRFFTRFSFGLGLSAVATGATVFAADVRSSVARFETYASVHEGESVLMTPSDFIKSLNIMKGSAPVDTDGFLQKLFRRVDTDGDGLLNYEEYCMFYTLLTNTEKDFKIAFDMFDENSDGKISASEFQCMMSALAPDPSAKIIAKGGLTEYLFGSDYNKDVSFSTMISLIRDIRSDVWWHEFKQLDREDKGRIPLAALHEFLFGTDAHAMIHEESANKQVSFQTYKMFNEIMLYSDDVIRALQLLEAGGLECTKISFARSLHLTGLKLTRQDIDCVFSLFDLNNDGTMSIEEFQEVVKRRQNFNAVGVDRRQPFRSIAQNFFYCMQQRTEE